MTLEETFKRLGLPKHSEKIYTAMKDRGPLTVTEIEGLTKVHRPTIYRALHSLLKQHFASRILKGKRKLYIATGADVISKSFSTASASLGKKLARMYTEDKQYQQRELRFMSGFNGIQSAFDDVISHLKHGETFYRYTSEKDLESVNKYLSKDYRIFRDKKKLERMVISNPLSGSRKRPRLERFVKFIPPKISLFDQNIIQLIYGSRVSLIDLNTERVLIIENKALADFQKVIFKQLYDKLPLP